MIFSVDERLFCLFPALKIGVLICEVENKRYGEDRLEAVLEDIRAGFLYEKPRATLISRFGAKHSPNLVLRHQNIIVQSSPF
jgi:hypothetical protein